MEVAAVLAVLAVASWAAVAPARSVADATRLFSAREIVVRGIARGRMAAVAAGGGTVTVLTEPPRIRVTAGGGVVHDALIGDGRTSLLLSGARDSLSLRFDGLGIGRFASASIGLRRGERDVGVVLSSYGRVRRR